MGKGINPDIIKSREMARYLLLPVVADICCSYDYWTVCELMNERFGNADAKQRKEVVDMLVSVSESWNRGRLVKGGEIILKDEFSDVPRVQPVSDEQKEMESRLPMNEKQVEWLQRWAADVPDEAPDPKSMSVATTADHFTKNWSKEGLQAIYENLIEYGYIAPQTTFEQWQYICTGIGENEPHTAIVWKATQSELAYLVSRFLTPKIKGKNGESHLWQIACKVFRLETGKPLNVNTMKSELNHKLDTKKWSMMKERLRF